MQRDLTQLVQQMNQEYDHQDEVRRPQDLLGNMKRNLAAVSRAGDGRLEPAPRDDSVAFD